MQGSANFMVITYRKEHKSANNINKNLTKSMNMKKTTFFMAMLAVAGLAAVSCSNDDEKEMETGGEAKVITVAKRVLKVADDGTITPQEVLAMSDEEFQSEIAEHGWKYADGHMVEKDGVIHTTRYLILGLSVPDYFFSNSVITEYASGIPEDGQNDYSYSSIQFPYTYSSESGTITFLSSETGNEYPARKEESMTLLEYDKEKQELTVLYHIIYEVYNKHNYILMTYRRMTDEELETTKKTYSDNQV